MNRGYEDHPLLPAAGPDSQAHILVKGVYETYDDDKFGDFIATFLLNLNKHPDALESFFDPNIEFFHLVRRFKEDQSAVLMEFMISRKKDTVIAGFFEILDDKNTIVWDCVTKNKMSEVGPDAEWETTWGAHVAYSLLPTESIWESAYLMRNSAAPTPHELAQMFGNALYVNQAWEGDEESEITLKTE